jgi:hypothetical protein
MTERELNDENRRMKKLRFLVDLTTAVLIQADLSVAEAVELVDDTRRAVLQLFPGKDDVYELIYAPRFRRILAERFTIPGSISGRN